MQAHDAVRQNVFFDHIGQLICCQLRLSGQPVQSFGKPAHHPRHARPQHHHNHRQLPVQIQQVAHQRNQGKAVARQPHERLHQHGGPRLHLVHHGVGQAAGRLAGKQPQLRIHQAAKNFVAQLEHAIVGNARQCVLRAKLGNAPQNEHEQYARWHHPQGQSTFAKALIQQGLEHGGHGCFRQRPHQRSQHGIQPQAGLQGKVGIYAAQPRPQRSLWRLNRRRSMVRRRRHQNNFNSTQSNSPAL